MSLNARRITYVVVVLGLMYVTTTTLFLELCRDLLGDDIGAAQATFWNLQCETYYTALMVAFALEWTWRLRRGDDGWTVATPPVARRVGTYAIFLALTLLSRRSDRSARCWNRCCPTTSPSRSRTTCGGASRHRSRSCSCSCSSTSSCRSAGGTGCTPRSPRRSRSPGAHASTAMRSWSMRFSGSGASAGDHDVLEPQPEPALEVDAGFDREGVARDQRQVVAPRRCTDPRAPRRRCHGRCGA